MNFFFLEQKKIGIENTIFKCWYLLVNIALHKGFEDVLKFEKTPSW